MQYKFPEIKTIDDVLPAIKDWDEINVTDKGDYIVVNYNVQFPETFTRNHVGWEIRRECRGLIFDPSGRLISRPFHKFFNVNEMPEVHESQVPVHEAHRLMEKEDGSMVRPFYVDGAVRLGTKMGVTDVGLQAETYLAGDLFATHKRAWMEIMLEMNLTPLFEYVGPNNRIVIDYEKEDLVLLAIRDNHSGRYHTNIFECDWPGTYVPVHSTNGIADMKGFLDVAKSRQDREGDILFFPDFGGMCKIKNDWYVQLHKILDQVRSWRHVADKMYKSEMDDVLPKLSPEDRNTITEFMAVLHDSEKAMVENLRSTVDAVYLEYGTDKKRIALEYVKNLDKHDAWIAKFIFAVIDGKGTCDQLVRDKIIAMTGSQTKFNECLHWLGMEKYID